MTFKERVKNHVNSDYKFKLLEKYVALIEKHNKFINLTGFSKDRLWKEGIYESILALEGFVKKGELLDIGAGAGFPSVPFLIANPEIKLTIYEPTKKRVNFLNIVNTDLNLNIKIFQKRAEESDEYEKYDFITARAVAPLKVLIEISHHLSKTQGSFVWLKGPKSEEEIDEAEKIISIFKIDPEIKKVKIYNKFINNIVYVKKTETPKGFPRKWKHIKNSK